MAGPNGRRVGVPSPATSLVLLAAFADHLRAYILKAVCKFDFLGHGHAVLGGQRRPNDLSRTIATPWPRVIFTVLASLSIPRWMSSRAVVPKCNTLQAS